jgi:hypothetical protein
MDQLRSFKGIANNIASIDFIIVDIPDNLVVPNISKANGKVPTWNVKNVGFLDMVF